MGAAGVASSAPSDGAAAQPLEPRSLASKLRNLSAQAGSGTGVYVFDPSSGGQVIFSDDSGVRYWLPAVERFLAKNGVPFEAMVPSEAAMTMAS